MNVYTIYFTIYCFSCSSLFFLIQTNNSNFCLCCSSLDISNVMMIDYLLCYCLTMTCSDYCYFHCCYCCCCFQCRAMSRVKVESRDIHVRDLIHYLNRSQCFPVVSVTSNSRGYLMGGIKTILFILSKLIFSSTTHRAPCKQYFQSKSSDDFDSLGWVND